MAKCCVCTHLNSVEENKRHNNAITTATMKHLESRRRAKTPAVNPNEFCKLHGVGPRGMEMTGTPTGAFAPPKPKKDKK